MTVVTVLHPGAMGAAVAVQARRGGARVRWVSTGRAEATRQRAEEAGLDEFDSVAAALAGTDIVLSICPPAYAEDVARTIDGFTGVYVEANAIAPERTRRIAALLPRARVADGGIIGEPPQRPGTTRMYLSGAADGIPELFAGTDLEVIALPGEIGQASALKLAYASYQKASRVLAAVAHAAAAEHGVAEQLRHEADLLRSFPLADVREFAIVAAKAWRWGPEMQEIADMFGRDGLPEELAFAAGAVLRRWAQAKDRTDLDTDAALRMLRQVDV